ncbi:helix-turn-helix domain-containing protein [Bradyrhizobium sp. 1(2017)]|uniref:helix-turn-helix domain-containing protein n=1 Tax=Bradyrhizobium sp. 1(2017) TaxID=1404888 RepID=UPI00140EF0D8|nr:helix-turn-helix domain-containing protein [Bradyrhizobium sp. 1(2017)]QIO32188.1 helix-turn-helix domain-containing protein [Bradyrhizobium sp. 1(2017)]
MLMHLTSASLPRPHSLSELGMIADSNPMISLSEFKYRRGSEIYGEKEPAEYIYQVKSGTVRSYKLLPDGRRQINAFHVPGDIFGLENGGVHRFTAEAVVDTTVRLIRRESLDSAAENDGALTRNLLRMATTNLRHAENHMLLLGRKRSMERVAAFLIEMNGRLTAAGILALPMTRRDIADYLGLTIETISRSLSYLRELGILRFIDNNQRHLVILDMQQLAAFDRQN